MILINLANKNCIYLYKYRMTVIQVVLENLLKVFETIEVLTKGRELFVIRIT